VVRPLREVFDEVAERYKCIGALIDGHGGQIVKRDPIELPVAHPSLDAREPGPKPGLSPRSGASAERYLSSSRPVET
jgi:hypothetical protein